MDEQQKQELLDCLGVLRWDRDYLMEVITPAHQVADDGVLRLVPVLLNRLQELEVVEAGLKTILAETISDEDLLAIEGAGSVEICRHLANVVTQLRTERRELRVANDNLVRVLDQNCKYSENLRKQLDDVDLWGRD